MTSDPHASRRFAMGLPLLVLFLFIVAGYPSLGAGQTSDPRFLAQCREPERLRPQSIGWKERPGRKTTQTIPDLPLTDAEKESLYRGEPIVRLLPGTDQRKIGWLRFFAPFDPVTAFWVVTDAPHYSLQDPMFPASGSLWNKRQTYMPYVFENHVCEREGLFWNFQYLVTPFISPRIVSTSLCRNRDDFPWEAAWWSDGKLPCREMAGEALKKEIAQAVPVDKNVGAWHVGPLPREFRRTPADLQRSQLLFLVDTDPGGSIGDLTLIVNHAHSVSLPALARQVLLIGQRYGEFLKKYQTPEDRKGYEQERAQYLRLWVTDRPPMAEAGKPAAK